MLTWHNNDTRRVITSPTSMWRFLALSHCEILIISNHVGLFQRRKTPRVHLVAHQFYFSIIRGRICWFLLSKATLSHFKSFSSLKSSSAILFLSLTLPHEAQILNLPSSDLASSPYCSSSLTFPALPCSCPLFLLPLHIICTWLLRNCWLFQCSRSVSSGPVKACKVQVSDPGSASAPPIWDVWHDWTSSHSTIIVFVLLWLNAMWGF